MNIKQFTDLLEKTMTKAAHKAGGMDRLNCCLSRPSIELAQLYGPMTDKVLKDRSKQKAQELYDNYHKSNEFKITLHSLGCYVERMASEATNGGLSSMSALSHINRSFGANLTKVLEEVREPHGKIEGIILAVADMAITSALAFVPVAGPFIVPLTQGINGALGLLVNGAMTGGAFAGGDNSFLFMTSNAGMKISQSKTIAGDSGRQDLTDGAATAGRIVNEGVRNVTGFAGEDSAFARLTAQRGIASLIVTAARIAIEANNTRILAMPDSSSPSFARLIQGTAFSQNQQVGRGASTLDRLRIALPQSLAADPRRRKIYLNEKASLCDFKDMTATMFSEFFELFVKIINLGIKDSFRHAINDLDTPNMSESQKIALLILGYFYSKDYDGARVKQRQDNLQILNEKLHRVQDERSKSQSQLERLLKLTDQRHWHNYRAGDITDENGLVNKFDKIDELNKNSIPALDKKIQDTEGQIKLVSARSNFSTLKDSFKGGADARQAYDLAQNALSKKKTLDINFSGMGDLDKLEIFKDKAQNYFTALKGALTADIATALAHGNNGFLGDDDFIRMWKLFIGSQLIVNFALNDSKIKLQGGPVRKLVRAITPTTDATDIPDHYVKMIEDAGFIERYAGDLRNRASLAEKKKLAATGKMRWSRSPGNTERAMLICFATVVAFTMDVGRISLGFYSWSDTVASLREVCKTISSTAWAELEPLA